MTARPASTTPEGPHDLERVAPRDRPSLAKRLSSVRRVAGSRSLALLAVLLPTHAFAWGDDGHRIVGQIAWNALTPTAQTAVAALLPPGDFDTLASASTWPDVYARTDAAYDWAKPQHYVGAGPTRPVTLDARTCPDDPAHGPACVVGAIGHHAAIVADVARPASERVESLRFLAHFVGDLHQPLHVFHVDGRGGTLTFVRDGHTPEPSIHLLWDVTLVEALRAQVDAASHDASDWGSLARHLERELEPPAADATRSAALPAFGDDDVQTEVTAAALAWADESHALAQRRRLFGLGSHDRLPRSYARIALPIVSARLEQAGLRLAAILNWIFRPAS